MNFVKNRGVMHLARGAESCYLRHCDALSEKFDI